MTKKFLSTLIALLLATTPLVAQQYPSPTVNNMTVQGNLSLPSKPAGNFFVAPSGSAGAPSFRSMVAADMPGDQRKATAVNIGTTTANGITFTTNNTARWSMFDTGSFAPNADNAYLLGFSNARIATGYFANLGDATNRVTNGYFDLTQVGTAQSAIGQKGQVTAPYPASSSDIFRVEVGGFPIANEYSNANPTTSAIVGAVMIPNTATASVMSDPGVSGYSVTNTANRPAMGLYGSGGIGVSGASAWGLNTQPVNCQNHSSGCIPGAGLDFGLVYGAEANVTVYSKSGGVAPSGSADGFVATASGDIRPTGSYAGVHVARAPIFANNSWKYGIVTDDAASQRGASIGSATTAASSASQEIELVSRDGSNVRQFSYMKTDATKRFNFDNDLVVNKTGNAAITLNNTAAPSIWNIISTATGLQFFDGGNQLEITNTVMTVNNDLSVNGVVSAPNGIRIPNGTPASASSACPASALVYDANFLYVCVATNTWKRAALSTW